MCLGIVGRVKADSPIHPDLVDVDVGGVVRPIHRGPLAGEPLAPGDWILIHAGCALERIDETTARRQLAALRAYTGDGSDAEALGPP